MHSVTFLFLILVAKVLIPDTGFAQEQIRVGVPLFPTVSYPVFIAQEKGFFEKHRLKVEIIRQAATSKEVGETGFPCRTA